MKQSKFWLHSGSILKQKIGKGIKLSASYG